MKIEVYWVVRHGTNDESAAYPVAGPFCDRMEAYHASEAYEDRHIMRRDCTTVRAQEIEVS